MKNVKCGTNWHFRNQDGKIMKIQLMSLEQTGGGRTLETSVVE
jgi:hypothetical protein